MPFQSVLNTYPAQGAPGQRAGLNPVAYALPVPVAGASGVIVGNAVWIDPATNLAGNNVVSVAASAGRLVGGVITAELAALQAVTGGSMTISVNGTAKNITGMDFSAITELAGIAGVVNTALTTALAPATASWDSEGGCLVITSELSGASSSVSYAGTYSSGTDVSELLMLGAEVSVSVPGSGGASVAPAGIAQRNLSGEIAGTGEAGNVIAAGCPVPVVARGDVTVVSAQGTTAGQKVYANMDTGALVSAPAGGTIAGFVETAFTVRESAAAGNPFTISNW